MLKINEKFEIRDDDEMNYGLYELKEVTDKQKNMDKDVFIVEKNVRGAWVIFGALGVRQYYGYSKAEAVKKYRESVKQQIMEVKDGKKRQAVGVG